MRKYLFVFILSLVFFSCNEEVKPNSESLNAIINSNNYKIKIDIVGGSVAGSFTDQMIIEIKNNHLKSKSNFQNLSKQLNDIQKDSLKMLLNNLVELHVPEKVPLEFGGCTIHDENYTIENDSIKIKIKPHFNNSVYYNILELIE